MESAKEIIRALALEPLAEEGGFFRELYRSKTPAASPSKRCAGTSIYYLLSAAELSRWHRVASDEIWMYHAGSPAIQMLLFPDGRWEERVIGPCVLDGQAPQSVISAGVWQAARLLDSSPGSWGLFGAAVFPGFEYEDFEAGSSEILSASHPGAAARMKSLGLL